MKKFLLSLFIGFVGILNFCSATEYTCTSTGCSPRIIVFDSQLSGKFHANLISQSSDNLSLHYTSKCGDYDYLKGGSVSISTFTNGGISCTQGNKHFQFIMLDYLTSEGTVIFSYTGNDTGGGSCPECPTCPEVNTGEILSGYVLESEIDTNYCVGNGLCPNECGSGTDFSGDLQYSNLYINNILHPGTQNIFVDIPDYITWDYSFTGDNFNLYVGSGYDVEYIESIIDINSYRPDSKDFTDIFVGGLTLITPYIVIILFFYLVRRLLKKIFS